MDQLRVALLVEKLVGSWADNLDALLVDEWANWKGFYWAVSLDKKLVDYLAELKVLQLVVYWGF